jgi:sec-independent protein translocase protein TatA
MFGLGTGEIVLILVVLLVLFGAKRLPQLGETIGKTVRGLRKAAEAGSAEEPPEKRDPQLPPGQDRAQRAPEPKAPAEAKRG